MLINLIKFVHILLMLALVAGIIASLFQVKAKKFTSNRFDNSLLITCLLLVFTGTLLVHPKHFSFHTIWIQVAYVLIILFGLALLLSRLFKKPGAAARRWAWAGLYLFLLLILFCIIHDAVTKLVFFQ
jgi:hypothetical protein